MKRLVPIVLLLSFAAAADVIVKGGSGANQAKVNTEGSLAVNEAASTRVTYIATVSGVATTALYNLTIEAGASQGFKVSQICVGVSNATAAAAVNVTVNRRTTASTGGTVIANEATANAVSKMDPADASWAGIVRLTGTLGTIGPTLDSWSFQVGELGAGTADAPGLGTFCKVYGLNGEKLPRVVAGVTNGLSVNVSAPGAGGLASGSISITFIAE
jgi:hypothetical protein